MPDWKVKDQKSFKKMLDQNPKDQVSLTGNRRTKQITLSCTNVTHIQVNFFCKLNCNSVKIFSTIRYTRTRTHTHKFSGPVSGTTQVSRYQKGKNNLDFTEARDYERQCHQLGHMQVCNSLQTENHASTSPLSFLQAGCPSCRLTNSVKALKAHKVVAC